MCVYFPALPGIFHKLPFTAQDWIDWAFHPADDGTVKFMVELGKADAAAWARHVGITKPQQAASAAHVSGSSGPAAASKPAASAVAAAVKSSGHRRMLGA